ncbi:MAG TPA: DeoR family transcriptional regulator [Rhizobium sp.]|nr:DeoR family transcriptional regulator [Rhizobium sp.]
MSIRKETRLKRLRAAVAQNKTLHVRDAAELLDVSEMTIRRDVRENDSIFDFIGGHIIITDSKVSRPPYELARADEVNPTAKHAACSHCLPLIREKDVIFVDCGTTLTHLVSMLPNDMELTLICYALNIVDLAIRKSKMCVILLGGVYHPTTASFYPMQEDPILSNTAINTAFLSAAGLDFRLGATCTTFHEAAIKRAAMQRAQQNVLVIDTSKIGLLRTARFADANEFDHVFTEDGPLEQPSEIQ